MFETVEVDVLVVGAGPTGLGAAIRLEELGKDSWLLCEQSAKVRCRCLSLLFLN